jgi:hypothetical protein
MLRTGATKDLPRPPAAPLNTSWRRRGTAASHVASCCMLPLAAVLVLAAGGATNGAAAAPSASAALRTTSGGGSRTARVMHLPSRLLWEKRASHMRKGLDECGRKVSELWGCQGSQREICLACSASRGQPKCKRRPRPVGLSACRAVGRCRVSVGSLEGL